MAVWLWLAACSGGTSAPKAPDPAKSTVVLDRSTEVANDTSEIEAVVTGLDGDGMPLTDTTVKVELSGAGANVRPSSGGLDPSGKATALLRSSLAEEKTVTVTLTKDGKDVVLDMKPKVKFVPGTIDRIVFANQPVTVDAGTVMPPIHVKVVDRFRNVVPSPQLTVEIRLAEGTPGAVLTGGAAKTTVDGGVTFDMLSVDRAGTGYGLQLRQVGPPGWADDSERFNVTP